MLVCDLFLISVSTMGICPCRRDADPAKKEKEETLLKSMSSDTVMMRPRASSSPSEDDRLAGRLGPSYGVAYPLKRLGSICVYKAQHIHTKQDYVIKQIPKGKFRFPTQAKTYIFKMLSKLDHPNVVKTFEVVEDETTISMISELCEGGDLEEFLEKRSRLSHACAATVMHQVLSALAYSHNQGVTHKSLCLANLILKEPPKGDTFMVKVSGFENFELTRGDREKTFSCFIAPEVLSGEISEKCDIWSSGVIFYMLLSGHKPFENSQLCQSKKITYRDLPFPPDLWNAVSEEVISLITSMVNLRASARPSALQCLAHPWLQQHSKGLSLSSKQVVNSLSNLRSRAAVSMLKETMMLFIINRVLKGSELARLADIFTALDQDGDGVISREELVEAFKRSMTPEKAALEADRILSKVDRNQNGSIDYSEFLLTSVTENRLLSQENLRIAFASLDSDASGTISAAELKRFFKANINSESDSHWRELVSEFAGEGSEEIDFPRFELLMTKVLKN